MGATNKAKGKAKSTGGKPKGHIGNPYEGSGKGRAKGKGKGKGKGRGKTKSK